MSSDPIYASRFLSADQIKDLPYMVSRDYGHVKLWVPTTTAENFHHFQPTDLGYIIFQYDNSNGAMRQAVGALLKYDNQELMVPIGPPPHAELIDDQIRIIRQFFYLNENDEAVIPFHVVAYHDQKPKWEGGATKEVIKCVRLHIRTVGDYLATNRYYPVIIPEKPLN